MFWGPVVLVGSGGREGSSRHCGGENVATEQILVRGRGQRARPEHKGLAGCWGGTFFTPEEL